VTAVELFFDLVFAFTLTQLTVVITAGLTAVHVLQVLLIFGLLWWMYGGYAWLTNARAPVLTVERLLLLVGMAGFLIVGLAIPHGFGDDGVALGLGYLLVVCVHSGLYARVNQEIWRIAPFNIASALLVVLAGVVGGVADYLLFLAALAIQAISPLIVKLGGRFDIRSAHFAERHGALVIIAIGESIAAIGIGAAGLPVDASLVLAATLGLALSATLWWAYFGNGDDERGEDAMSSAGSDRRPALALAAYFYAHMPMLLGVVFIAAGVRAATGHGGSGGLPGALALGLGAAAFIGGTVAFRSVLQSGPITLRLAGAAFALITVPLGTYTTIEAQLGLLTVGLIVMLAAERRAPRPAEE
jgi:low temperature requirement protein LtrA